MITFLINNSPIFPKKWEKVGESGKFIPIFASKSHKDMSNPIGTFNCKLDSKGRLSLPADFREQLGEQADEFFVMRPGLHGTYLELYTMRDWLQQEEIFRKLNRFDKRTQQMVRAYTDGSRRAKLDASGRILIPKELLDRGKLSKDIVINSMVTSMEIWDKEIYDANVGSLSSEELAKGIEELFAGFSFGV